MVAQQFGGLAGLTRVDRQTTPLRNKGLHLVPHHSYICIRSVLSSMQLLQIGSLVGIVTTAVQYKIQVCSIRASKQSMYLPTYKLLSNVVLSQIESSAWYSVDWQCQTTVIQLNLGNLSNGFIYFFLSFFIPQSSFSLIYLSKFPKHKTHQYHCFQSMRCSALRFHSKF